MSFSYCAMRPTVLRSRALLPVRKASVVVRAEEDSKVTPGRSFNESDQKMTSSPTPDADGNFYIDEMEVSPRNACPQAHECQPGPVGAGMCSAPDVDFSIANGGQRKRSSHAHLLYLFLLRSGLFHH